jgi:hypothetical protein
LQQAMDWEISKKRPVGNTICSQQKKTVGN